MSITKNIFKNFVSAALVAVVGLSMLNCGGGGKNINSPEALLEYLNSQPANTPDKPIKVSMKVNEQMIPDIRGVINRANKYVSLNLTGSPLTEIPEDAFAAGSYSTCQNLVEIIIPNGVTRIGSKAFDDCENLVNVNIPNSVTEIGHRAFRNTAITNITIPDGVTSIAMGTFAGCTSLVSVTVPNSITEIGSGAFNGTRIKSITIPNGVTTIGREAFSNSTAIKEITIPSSVTEVGTAAFNGWTNEQTINIPFANQEAADAAWGIGWRTVYTRTNPPIMNYVGQ